MGYVLNRRPRTTGVPKTIKNSHPTEKKMKKFEKRKIENFWK